ncbi:MAG: hypothetical protein NTV46_06235, partial [Verrucomicrobia bacterium]|nr:hypothetical protein [Verrucomicrobiota bacterium]
KRDPMTGNLNRRIAESDNIVLVSIYKQKWVPPEGRFAKGEMIYYARVVSSFKGDLIVGRKIEFSYYLEESPRWLEGFESSIEGKMEYLFLGNKYIKKGEEHYIVKVDCFGFDFHDPHFANLFRKKLTTPSRIIDPMPADFD